jgi:hypothetical protein
MSLKELEVKYATKRQRPYKLSDGEGLHLLVRPNGSKLWRLKYRFDGKEKLLSFGKCPAVTLAIARQKRSDAKALLDQGKDPGIIKKQKRRERVALNLFEEIARAWHANHVEGLDPAHASRIVSRMERDVFPVIGKRPIIEIDAPEIPRDDSHRRGPRRARRQPPTQAGRQPGLSIRDCERMGGSRPHAQPKRCAQAQASGSAHAPGPAHRVSGAGSRGPGL